MSQDQMSEESHKAIFLALVEAQDGAMTVAQSRSIIATRFGVSESQIRQIERQGLDNKWPPL